MFEDNLGYILLADIYNKKLVHLQEYMTNLQSHHCYLDTDQETWRTFLKDEKNRAVASNEWIN